MIFIALIVKLTSTGLALSWSDRIEKGNTVLKMPKFRTMRQGTPTTATHLLNNPDRYVTPIGRILRKLSLDELPQLFSVLKGDMSFVGPRPALFNQDDLVALRTQKGIHRLVPGVTGWAQINGRDELPISVKVQHDEYYLHHRSFGFDSLIKPLEFCYPPILDTSTLKDIKWVVVLGGGHISSSTLPPNAQIGNSSFAQSCRTNAHPSDD